MFSHQGICEQSSKAETNNRQAHNRSKHGAGERSWSAVIGQRRAAEQVLPSRFRPATLVITRIITV
jgi:hypothetical protein